MNASQASLLLPKHLAKNGFLIEEAALLGIIKILLCDFSISRRKFGVVSVKRSCSEYK